MDIMLDLETLGTKPGCVILSIGAVAFNPGTPETESYSFYKEISIRDSENIGLKIDVETVAWWKQQQGDAQSLLKRCENTRNQMTDVLYELNFWLGTFGPISTINIWANDPSFDCSILKAAYELIKLDPSWKFYNERSCRTMVHIGRQLGIDPKKQIPFTGIPHHALDDAKHQAKYITAIHRYIHDLEKPQRYEISYPIAK
ncbi:MAG: 3'-5' exoribonuclease [Oceanospirillaceae bacterium]|nr:3'-5' exoribonuclease [Oceanospirillaceae bacterium]